MSNTLIAIAIIGIVIQQLIAVFGKALDFRTLDDTGKKALYVDITTTVLGVLLALALRVNIVPDDTFPDASVWVLYALSGLVFGGGADAAIGVVKLGAATVQAAKAQAVIVSTKAQTVLASSQAAARKGAQTVGAA